MYAFFQVMRRLSENVHVLLFDRSTYLVFVFLFVVVYVSLFAWKLSCNVANTWTNFHIIPIIFSYVRILQIKIAMKMGLICTIQKIEM